MQNLCGFALFFFFGWGVVFLQGECVGRCKKVFSSIPNKLKFTQLLLEIILKKKKIFFYLWHLFFKHSFPSCVFCSTLSVKYREATSNCGFPEGAETFKMRAGSRSVSWKCQLSPSEEASMSGTSWIILPRPYTWDSQILPEGEEKRGSNTIYHPCLSTVLAKSSNICGTAERLLSTFARKVMQR